jgi:hypothetical protein
VETDEIIDSAKKAAESQKEPLDAIKFLDQDIAKVRRGIGELDDLVKKQNLARLGTSATEAAKGFSKLSADSAQFFDNANLLLQRTENVDKGMKTVLKTSEAVTSAGSLSAQAGSQMLRNEAAKQGFQLSEARGPEYGIMQEAGRGVFQDKAYQEQTGYTPPEEALKKAAIQVAGQKFKDTGLKALGEYANNGAVSPQTKSDLSTAETAYRDAYKATGLDPTQAINEVYGMSTATSQAQGALGQQGVQPSLATILTGQTVAAVAPAPAAAPVTAATPVSAIPAAPAASPATAAPAAATPAAAVPAAPVSAAPAQMTTAPVVARTSAGAVNVGTATTSSGTPVNINLSVTLDAGAMTKVLASQGVAMVGP